MEIYIARQPIFNRKMNIYGYELLYRRSMNNYYEGKSDDQSTAELINNAFLSMQFNKLTGGTRAFINFSENMICNEIPLLLPKDAIIVEILERIKITDEVIKECKNLKSKGYLIALDDFVFHKSYLPLIDLADIIKIEFSSIPFKIQSLLLKRYGHKIKFLAEKIETREEYQLAFDMGYDYFQGYFFSKPVIFNGKEIDGLNANLITIIHELNQEEPNFTTITEICKRDLGLSYKLLKIANSSFFGSMNKITSISQALLRLGINELKKWIYLMMLKEVQNIENKELIKSCLVRGKLMESLAGLLDITDKKVELFTTGMFSSIDVLLNQSMEDILKELPFEQEVKDALLGKPNSLGQILNSILNYEKLNWINQEDPHLLSKIPRDKFMELYIGALGWVMEFNY